MSSPILIKIAPSERRREDRVIYCDEVSVTLFNADGMPTYLEHVRCIEVSDHGVRLSVSVRIPPGQLMVISASKPGLEASDATFAVAWCELVDSEYQLGGKLISSPDNWRILA